MKYWYNTKLDAYRMATTKPDAWVRFDGTVCEWKETTKQAMENAYKAWVRGERVL